MNVTRTEVQYEQQRPAVLHLPLRSPQGLDPSLQRRLALLVGEINTNPAFGPSERALARKTVQERSTEAAITYIFFDILGQAEHGPHLEDLLTHANDLFEDMAKVSDQDTVLKKENEEILQDIFAAEVGATVNGLENWQEALAGRVEHELDERMARVAGAEQNVRDAIHEIQSTGETTVPIEQRLDAQAARLKSGIGRLEKIMQDRRKNR